MSTQSAQTAQTPPPQSQASVVLDNPGGTAQSHPPPPQPTPRKSKPGSNLVSQANYKEDTKQDNKQNRSIWFKMAENGFAGMLEPMELLEDYMITAESTNAETKAVTAMVNQARRHLNAAIDVYNGRDTSNPRRNNEKLMIPSFIKYLEALVEKFPEDIRPLIIDSQYRSIQPLDENDHDIKPDVLATYPGVPPPEPGKPWTWPAIGTDFEFKDNLDIFDDATEEIRQLNPKKPEDARKIQKVEDALVQIVKSGRSLLMSSGRCYSWVMAMYKHDMARIFCFDRTGFVVSKGFEWLAGENQHIIPTFMYRLYHPAGHLGRIDGDDFTISRPLKDNTLKSRIYEALRRNSFYAKMFPDCASATDTTISLKASRRDVDGFPQPVTCYTIGNILSVSDGLFGRATRVYRVILAEDLDEENPQIYALKDAWREACRRPEIDYYDFIAKCSEGKEGAEGMATCHGSVDLGALDCDIDAEGSIQRTRIIPHPLTADVNSRIHVRSLLTPVGRPLREFPSTEAMCWALYRVVQQHFLAFQAGVLHRDISEGNVMFVEATSEGEMPQGFLLDWDYAEFTADGAQRFNQMFESRQQAVLEYVEKALSDMTGTRPFMAIELMRTVTQHAAHHDLESVYWLLMWMILRHTAHNDSRGSSACGHLFDPFGPDMKQGYLVRRVPVDAAKNKPLYMLATNLRRKVADQNPDSEEKEEYLVDDSDDSEDVDGHEQSASRPGREPVRPMDHPHVLRIFKKCVAHQWWPLTGTDPAIDFVPPSKEVQTVINATDESTWQSTGQKRARADAGEETPSKRLKPYTQIPELEASGSAGPSRPATRSQSRTVQTQTATSNRSGPSRGRRGRH
ncbi:hypothetical protein MIND_00767300 [Mycena indigotica]|uniref:Fungal-type protein kinase domain-containing protein n=1 Tax=Mycena indigotica TaxID=2126181 RepID=A0A8H6SNB3_9AGAR|nr:uncharacterized protein MIND_00767300 [Mycena indigotica]KAF7302010.1 hypothetical protein MIND_00767300 [Mycena indigotica]